MNQRPLQGIMTKFLQDVQLVQRVNQADVQNRLRYAVQIEKLVHGTTELSSEFDDGHIHSNGVLNKQNFRLWALKNSKIISQLDLLPTKCTVFCGIIFK
ncbi:hypothetical protein NPIL_338541 [Nephila pilipes]|uniref:Uncharacterized protein n=1 Tax=Nephila pilipes TaxID=299642 RepID=A0A8X6MHJ1_NEPPI|nr:hypothetical protein NPIL_338541 [Nephila pilipes]